MSKWLIEKLRHAQSLLRQMESTLRQADAAAHAANDTLANQRVLQLTALSEETTLALRATTRYIPHQTTQNASQVAFTTKTTWDISRNENGAYRIVCPRLLPSKQGGNVRWLRESLYPVLDAYFREHGVTKIDPAVLVVRTVYPAGTPERWMTDHDNMEFSEATDLVALYTMATDNPAHCSNYYCSMRSDSDEERTEIFVIPRSEFPQWLRENEP
jgi:hypothetical protein